MISGSRSFQLSKTEKSYSRRFKAEQRAGQRGQEREGQYHTVIQLSQPDCRPSEHHRWCALRLWQWSGDLYSWLAHLLNTMCTTSVPSLAAWDSKEGSTTNSAKHNVRYSWTLCFKNIEQFQLIQIINWTVISICRTTSFRWTHTFWQRLKITINIYWSCTGNYYLLYLYYQSNIGIIANKNIPDARGWYLSIVLCQFLIRKIYLIHQKTKSNYAKKTFVCYQPMLIPTVCISKS